MSKQSARGPAWEAIRKAVLERDSSICAYCGGHANTVDHVIPVNAGGKEDMGNLVAACLTCNGRKSDRMVQRVSGANPRWMAL